VSTILIKVSPPSFSNKVEQDTDKSEAIFMQNKKIPLHDLSKCSLQPEHDISSNVSRYITMIYQLITCT